MSDIVLILTTWPDKIDAQKAAKNWLNKKLVACVNILPKMLSMYEWDGEIQTENEYQILVKTTSIRIKELKQSILESHPYECPEILILPVTGGYEDYLNWITGNTK